jgi:hypothetical protein
MAEGGEGGSLVMDCRLMYLVHHHFVQFSVWRWVISLRLSLSLSPSLCLTLVLVIRMKGGLRWPAAWLIPYVRSLNYFHCTWTRLAVPFGHLSTLSPFYWGMTGITGRPTCFMYGSFVYIITHKGVRGIGL